MGYVKGHWRRGPKGGRHWVRGHGRRTGAGLGGFIAFVLIAAVLYGLVTGNVPG